MAKRNFNQIICPGIARPDWEGQLKEINELGLEKAAVFVEWLEKPQREQIYEALLKSCVKEVPFVHLRDDTDGSDIRFFAENFNTRFFNIHEEHFNVLERWKGYWHMLYLEMNYDSRIAENIDVEKIGGFCVDFSHFKSAIDRGAKEASFIFSEKNKAKFACNHLNGYDAVKKTDVHLVCDIKQLDYLITLPKFIFGDIIALEMTNTIKEQLEFKKFIVDLLDKLFS